MVQIVKNMPGVQETRLRSLGQEDPPGEENGHPLQYSCLETTMDRGAWWATVHGVTKSKTWLRYFHYDFSTMLYRSGKLGTLILFFALRGKAFNFSLFFFFFLNFYQSIVALQCMLVPTVEQSESAVHVHISPLFWVSFRFRSPQIAE